MKIRKIMAVILCLILCMATCTACGSSPATSSNQTTGSGGSAKIKIGVYLWPSWYEWYVAEEQNFFKEAGLDVELVPFTSYSDMIQAFYSNNINVVGATVCDLISGYNEEKDFKVVLVNDYSNGADAIVFGNNIKTPEDIKGKSVAVEAGTLEHYMLLTALEKWGLKQDDVSVVNMSMSDAAPAMISGSVEVAAMADPYGAQVESAGKGKKYFTSADVPGLISDSTAVSGDLIKNNKEDVQKLVDVWYKTVEYVNANKEQSMKIMADKAELSSEEFTALYDGVKVLSREEMVKGFTDKKEDFTYAPYVAKKNADFLLGQQMTTESKDSYDGMFDDEFVCK